MSVIKVLKNKIFGNIYPITKFNAVIDDNGKNLLDYLIMSEKQVATRNSTYLSSGNCIYYIIGKICYVTFEANTNVAFNNAATTIFSNLPAPKETWYVQGTTNSGMAVPLAIMDDNTIKVYYPTNNKVVPRGARINAGFYYPIA